MSTATPASADVRTPPTDRAADLERQLHEARTEARLLRARTALRRLKESAALDYDWYGPWSEVQRQRDGDRAWVPVNGTHARRHGHYFPFFQNETQLATLRDLSRVVVGTNNHASGMLNGLTSFVIGTGFKLKVTPLNGDKALAQKVTDWFDEWIATNYWDEFQQEAFSRHREDGDALIRLFPDDGCLKVRHVWAEQLTQPPGTTVEEYGYGIRMPRGDEAAPEPEAYWFADLNNPAHGEEVPACDVIHLKANTRTGVKRGLPDFSFGTKDALDAAGRLTRNLGEGAAIREAIAFMRQHAAATEADVQAFVASNADFREREPTRESYRPVNVWAPGTVVDFPEGMEHAGAPANPGTAAHTAVVQVLLRSAGVRWNAPEWLISGDASNMGAYTSSLVAESPFVRSVQRAQGYYRTRFERIIRKALRLAVSSDYLPGDALTACKVELVPPSPEVRNKLEEVQRAQIEINLGTDSRQRVAEEQGRDWERVAKENQEYQDQFGAPGQQLPTDPFGGGGDTGGRGLPLPESVQTSALERALLESGFTGEIVDAANRYRKYVDGKQVAAGDDDGTVGGAAKPAAKSATKGAAPTLAALAKNPKADLKFIEKLQAQYPEGAIEREWLDVAKDNAAGVAARDLSVLAAAHGKGPEAVAHARRHYVLERLASAAAQARADGDAAGVKALAGAIAALGGTAHGPEPGAETGFDASYYDGPAGTFTGDPVRVALQPVTYNGALVYRGKVASGVAESLLEAGFTGTVKDSAGRERHYVDGKQVAAPKNDDGGSATKDGSAKSATPEERKAVEADLAQKLGPEAAQEPGLLARAGDAALTVAARVYLKLAEWQPAAWKALGALGAIVDTPDDMKKFGYNPAFGATSGVGQNDPVSANLGVSTHLALSVASNVLSRAMTLAKSKLGGAKTESEYDGVQTVAGMLADLFAAVNEELGATGGAPSADEVAANVRKLLGAN